MIFFDFSVSCPISSIKKMNSSLTKKLECTHRHYKIAHQVGIKRSSKSYERIKWQLSKEHILHMTLNPKQQYENYGLCHLGFKKKVAK